MGNRYHLSYHDVGYRRYWHVSNLGDFPTKAEAQAAIDKRIAADRSDRSADSLTKNITVPVSGKLYNEIRSRATEDGLAIGAYARQLLLTAMNKED